MGELYRQPELERLACAERAKPVQGSPDALDETAVRSEFAKDRVDRQERSRIGSAFERLSPQNIGLGMANVERIAAIVDALHAPQLGR